MRLKLSLVKVELSSSTSISANDLTIYGFFFLFLFHSLGKYNVYRGVLSRKGGKGVVLKDIGPIPETDAESHSQLEPLVDVPAIISSTSLKCISINGHRGKATIDSDVKEALAVVTVV